MAATFSWRSPWTFRGLNDGAFCWLQWHPDQHLSSRGEDRTVHPSRTLGITPMRLIPHGIWWVSIAKRWKAAVRGEIAGVYCRYVKVLDARGRNHGRVLIVPLGRTVVRPPQLSRPDGPCRRQAGVTNLGKLSFQMRLLGEDQRGWNCLLCPSGLPCLRGLSRDWR